VIALEQRIIEQQDQLRDYEKSLVERIADVDDDRRTTTSKLQRAWQTQREEINDRLGRQTAIVVGALVLSLVVLGAILFLAYREGEIGRQHLVDELAELKQGQGQTSGKPSEGEPLRDELTRLSAAVGEISSSLGRLGEEQAGSLDTILEDERIARDEADARIAAEIRRLDAKQKSLTQELESLRVALDSARTAKTEPVPTGLSPMQNAEPSPAREPVEVTVAPSLALSGTPSTVGASSPDKTPVATADRPAGDAEQKAQDAESSTDTQGTAFVGDRTYALQLIGLYDRDALLKFADRDDLPERLYYREEIVRGRAWFALIHSMHEDIASAEAELSRLSPDLIALDPWIRPIQKGVELKVLDSASRRE
jgi:DamX protein